MASRADAHHFIFNCLIACTRVGTDHLYWKSGRVGLSENLDFECRVGLGRVGDLVGRLVGIFGVNFAKKSDQNQKIKPENVKFVVWEQGSKYFYFTFEKVK